LSFLRKKGAKFKTLGQNIERLNEEIRKRERVIRIFTNRESVIRLLGALLMEQDEKWRNTLPGGKVRSFHKHIR